MNSAHERHKMTHLLCTSVVASNWAPASGESFCGGLILLLHLYLIYRQGEVRQREVRQLEATKISVRKVKFGDVKCASEGFITNALQIPCEEGLGGRKCACKAWFSLCENLEYTLKCLFIIWGVDRNFGLGIYCIFCLGILMFHLKVL